MCDDNVLGSRGKARQCIREVASKVHVDRGLAGEEREVTGFGKDARD